MKNLYDSIIQDNFIDGHIHLFDHQSFIYNYTKKTARRMVGFMDIDFKSLELYDKNRVIRYYDEFIKKYYDSAVTLLATGTDCQTMIDLYNTFPNVIKGFGEIKCYDYYNDENNVKHKLPYGNLKWIKPLCEFNKNLSLPIYIHYYVYDDNRKKELKTLLTEYPEIPFVLCHCGLSPFRDYKKQFDYVYELISEHNNLYVDISYKPMEFFINNIEYLNLLQNRYLIGTDLNPNYFINNPVCDSNNYIKFFKTLSTKCDTQSTFKKLFN